jgi:DNA-directed RNA polymerase sigma subunit (sigma70/sigma32)
MGGYDPTCALHHLTPRREQILRLRYGLDGEPPMTWAAIGRHFGVSGGRVQQLGHQALARLLCVMEEDAALVQRAAVAGSAKGLGEDAD